VADQFNSKYDRRPSVDMDAPDVYIDLRIIKNKMTLGLDLSGSKLFKRGYRQDIPEAPLKETLAAGIIEYAWDEGFSRIIDPMAGSGTLIIEAVRKHMNIPASANRRDFAFLRLKDDSKKIKTAFDQIRVKADTLIRTRSEKKFYACDKSAQTLASCRQNCRNAGVEANISFNEQDFFQPAIHMSKSLLVFNPPYGKRLETGHTTGAQFYEKIGDTLKKYCVGSTAWIFTEDNDNIKAIGLKPSKKKEMFNGRIPCRLLEYRIF
jgi:putative N6-adenine-specific DNA methylase